MWWACVAMGESGIAYGILERRLDGTGPHIRFRYRWG